MATLKRVDPPQQTDWRALFTEMAESHPGHWVLVTDHGLAPKSVSPFLAKVRAGKYGSADIVATEYNGTFEAINVGGEIHMRFVPNN